MTRVCLIGSDDVNLQYELLSRETAREALATYDLREPFDNAVGVETVSLGAAVALLNDLDWYLVRFVDEAMVLEPSVSEEEWLSRSLATKIRDDEVSPAESARFLKVYGLEPTGDGEPQSESGPGSESRGSRTDAGADGESDGDTPGNSRPDDPTGGSDAATDQPGGRGAASTEEPERLVEPMFVTRTGDEIPEYDLRDVEATLVERVTESEFGA